MDIISNRKEFEKAYYYQDIEACRYPKRYPCILVKIHEEGGLGGGYIRHVIFYPRRHHLKSYAAGFKAATDMFLKGEEP